jgi:intracellular septation protein A
VSSDETDERRTYVQTTQADPAAGTATIVTTKAAPAMVVAAAPAPPSQRNETVVTHRSTNTGAIAALVVGIVVLIGGIALIASEIRFLPMPYSIIVVLAFGLILLLLGASFIDRGSERQ